MRNPVIAMAKIVIRPTFSSAQARERVRGIVQSSLRQEVANVRVGGGAQLRGIAFEADETVLEHDELGFVALGGIRLDDLDAAVAPPRLVRRDEECVAQLVRD